MKHFKTDKKESVKTRLNRFLFNRYPTIRGTGSYTTFISSDWKEVHVKLPLSFRTRNIVGTVFGGSIYSSVDPIYMLQLMKILGKEYIVWDKAATIKFKKPIKKTVYAKFIITDELVDFVKTTILTKGKVDIDLTVQYVNKQGDVFAEIYKTIYIAAKEYYNQKNN